MHFIEELKLRNETLFYFGLVNLLCALVLLVTSFKSEIKVYDTNALYKPVKFALSIAVYSFTMAWYCYYLRGFQVNTFNWVTVVLLGFEIFYITLQAIKGQLSHYNVSTPFYSAMYVLMGLAASLVTLYTAYVAVLFFGNSVIELPPYYIWAIRLGLIIFVIFSFEGAAMGGRLNHSVGDVNNNSDIFLLGWSKTVGDLRIAHFIGMHTLQVLPILSFYLLKNTKATFILSALYLMLAIATLFQALQGKSIFQLKIYKNELIK